MFLYTVLICLPMLAFCQPQQDLLANAEFRRFDVDGDGNIEPRELQQYFRRFDTDGDNRISRQEYRAEVDVQHINNPQAHQALIRLFDEIDYDNNNYLDQSDYDTLFDNADANNNNLVNQNEFVTYFHQVTGGPVSG